MARGGYQKPGKTGQVAGPGKFSKRNDNQPISVPNVGDAEDLTHGDRQRLEANQRVAPLPRRTPPSVPSGSSASPLNGSQGRAAQPPGYLFEGETNRPDEPITEGLPFGPGAGPDRFPAPEPNDDMEVVLSKMVELTGDQAIFDMLEDHREFKAWRQEKQNPAPAPMQMPKPEIEQDVDTLQPVEYELEAPDEQEAALAGEEEIPEPSVETPAEPLPTELEVPE